MRDRLAGSFRRSRNAGKGAFTQRSLVGLIIVGLFAPLALSSCGPGGGPVCSQAAITLIRVRGSGDARATSGMLDSPGNEGNSGFQLTLDAASMALRQRAALAQWTVNEIDLDYPALDTGQISKDVKDLVKSTGQSEPKYLQSIQAGRNELYRVLNEQFACAAPRIVLMGYSQGALVVGDVLATLPDDQASQIDAALLFGDPRFDPKDPTARGTFDPKRHGIAVALYGKRSIGGRYANRVRNYCVSDDLVCQGPDPSYALYVVGTLGLDLARTVLNGQKNAHARGYACGGISTDSACRSYLENRHNSYSKTAGLFAANVLAIPSVAPNTAVAGSATRAPDTTVAQSADSTVPNTAAGDTVPGDTAAAVATAVPASTDVVVVPQVVPTAAAPPTADAGGPYVFTQGLPAVFSGANSSDETTEIVQWEWDFTNDGTYDVTSDVPTTDHVFNAVGSGVATLRVTNSDGITATTTASYTVQAPSVDLSVAVTGLSVSSPALGPVASWDAYSADGGVEYIVRDHTGAIIDSVVGLQIDLSGRPDVESITVSALTYEGETVQTAPVAVVHGTTYNSMAPLRLLDTRQGVNFTTYDHQAEGGGVVAGGTEVELLVSGRAGVPSDAAAVVLNVTVFQPVANGFLTVYPCGTTRPTVSNLNYAGGRTVANSAIVHPGAAGTVCIYTSSSTHIIADINGYYRAGSQYVALTPARVLETRNNAGTGTIDSQGFGHGRLVAGEVLPLQLAGRAGVPFEAGAAVLNVTVTATDSAGYITVYPCDVARPEASNLNFAGGQTVANTVIAQTDASGKVCLYTSSATHLIVDVNGYYPAGPALTPTAPARLMDTRSGPSFVTFDSAFQGTGAIVADQESALQVTGRGIINPGASAVMLNVTVTGTTGRGFLTVYPCGVPRPQSSSLNFEAAQTVAAAVIVKVGDGGQVCFYSNRTTNLVVDLNAFHAYP